MSSGYILNWKGVIILLIIMLDLLTPAFSAQEGSNDLWFLISSYEDIGITVQELSQFLVAHGYNARAETSFVSVTLPSGGKVYLTPNGGAPGLADMWMSPPSGPTQPTRVSASYAVKKNATYHKTSDPDFIKSISRSVQFPVTPLGMCYEGSNEMGKIYKDLGYNVTYMYRQDNPGHEWVLVENDSSNMWLAVDSYFGIIKNSNDYYTASYSFPNPSYLALVNPQWRTG